MTKEQQQELIAKVKEFLTEYDWTNQEMQWFLRELSVIDITTAAQFEERFVFDTKDYRPHRDFVQYLVWEVFGWGDDIAELPGLVIDWELSWEQNYRHDYCNFYFEGANFYFSNA